MSTLSNITQETRLILKIIAGLGIFFIIIFLLFQGFLILRNSFFPAKPSAPEEKFGKINNIRLPHQVDNLSYSINTVSGLLPSAPDRMDVYQISKPSVSLLSLEKIRTNLADLGYKDEENKISDSEYEWKNSLGMEIRYDITTNNFDIVSSESAQQDLAQDLAFDKEGVIETISSFLNSLNINTNDIDFNNSLFSYFIVKDGTTSPTAKESEANLVKVDLVQNNLNNYKISYPNLNGSSMYFELVNFDRRLEIVSAHFNHSVVNTNSFSSYGIKTPTEAFSELKEGKALIYNNSRSNKIDILDISRGYYLEDGVNEYLLPIYVFSGNDFKAYVPALKD